nr:hypothetical protein [Armatimonadota bacterium]
MEVQMERWMRPAALATALLTATLALPNGTRPVWGAPDGNTTTAALGGTNGGFTVTGGAGST